MIVLRSALIIAIAGIAVTGACRCTERVCLPATCASFRRGLVKQTCRARRSLRLAGGCRAVAAVIFAFVIATVFATLCSLTPALRAARLNPAVALRAL